MQPLRSPWALLQFLLLLLIVDVSWCNRAGDAVSLDGLQAPFNTSDPADPGFLFFSPFLKSGNSWCRSSRVPCADWPARVTFGQVRVSFGNNSRVMGTNNASFLRHEYYGGHYRMPGVAGYGLFLSSDSTLHWAVALQSGLNIDLTAPMSIDRWTHVAGVVSADQGSAALYVDGVAVASQRFPPSAVSYRHKVDFVAGVLLGFNRPPLGYFAGRLDEVRVWSSAKSAAAVEVGMLDTLPSDPDRNGLVYVPSLELYLPNNQVRCSDAENLCVNGMQKWMVGDDGRLQLMGFAAQCLALSSPVVSLGLPMQCTLCIAADYMRWLPLLESDSLATPHLLRTGASSFPLVCLSGSRERPYAGKVLFLVECMLSDQDDDGNFMDRRHMQWRLLETGEYKHELSGLCMTASFGNGGPVFLANCLVVTDDVLLEGVAIDYTPYRRFGSFVGGARFEVSLAPIDRAPAFTLFNGQTIKSSLQRVYVQVGRAVSFVLQARDPNLSDTVTIEVFGNIPTDATISPSIPDQLATRVFTWTPSSSNLLYNPTDIYCQVIDAPANPLNPNIVANPSSSSELQVQMVVLLPPEWAVSAPAPGAVFEARIGETLEVAMVAIDRNAQDAVQIEFGQNCHASSLPPLPLSQVSLGLNIPAPGPPPFPNPVTRIMSFSPLPAHSNKSFCACFVAKSAGADSPIRCIVIRVLEFTARFIDGGEVGAVLPSFYPVPGEQLQRFSQNLSLFTSDAVQLLQGQAVSWAVGVSVAGASGFTLSSSRIVYLPAAGYHEVTSSAFAGFSTHLLDPYMRNVSTDGSSNISSSDIVDSSVVSLEAVWSVGRGQPGAYIVCFVLSIPIVRGPLYQQEGCYLFSVLACAVAAVEGDTLYQIGSSHGLSFVDMLLVNTHLQTSPDHLLPGDIVATAVAHQIDVSCSIGVLADAMLVTPQRLREFNSFLSFYDDNFMLPVGSTVCVPLSS